MSGRGARSAAHPDTRGRRCADPLCKLLHIESLRRLASTPGEVMVKQWLQNWAVKGCLACALATAVLWWVVEHSGPRLGTVILHVMERDVEVTLADQVYAFEEMTDKPLV